MRGTVQEPDPYDQKFKLADGHTRDKESLEEKINYLMFLTSLRLVRLSSVWVC